MKVVIETIIKDILCALYYPFWFALAGAFFFMFFYMQLKDNSWKSLFKQWISDFRSDKEFRKMFYLVLYIAIMLDKFFSVQNTWLNSLADVLGGWTFYTSKGDVTTANVQNIILYIPFIILLFWKYHDKVFKTGSFREILGKSFKIAILVSLASEFVQLVMRVNYVRISDVVYNVCGGLIGGIIYYLIIGRRKHGNS